MPGPRSLIGWLWAAFVVCWLVLAQFNKKASRRTPLRAGWGLRVAILIGVLIVVVPLHRNGVAGRLASIGRSLPLHPGITQQWVGAGLCLAGFAFAVWFLFSARTEEKMLVAQFPQAYPAYRRRTKMLRPFVL